MPIYRLENIEPQLTETCWVAPDAHIIGHVIAGEDVSIWFGTVIRGDNEPISIGNRSNIQDRCMIHTDPGYPVEIGEDCTVGHHAIVHGATIGDNTLIGMGATLLNGARIGKNCLVGANALVTEGKEYPDNSLIVGSPAKVVRTLSDGAAAGIRKSAESYVANYKRYLKGLELIDRG